MKKLTLNFKIKKKHKFISLFIFISGVFAFLFQNFTSQNEVTAKNDETGDQKQESSKLKSRDFHQEIENLEVNQKEVEKKLFEEEGVNLRRPANSKTEIIIEE